MSEPTLDWDWNLDSDPITTEYNEGRLRGDLSNRALHLSSRNPVMSIIGSRIPDVRNIAQREMGRILSHSNSKYIRARRAAEVPVNSVALLSAVQEAVDAAVINDLQGFEGPVPVSALREERRAILVDVVMPADGGVLRYLRRVLCKGPNFVRVSVHDVRRTAFRTIDGSSAETRRSNPNLMRLVVSMSPHQDLLPDLPDSHLVSERVQNLGLLRRIKELGPFFESFNKVLTTLSRRLAPMIGAWGETPKFPIVNFPHKMSAAGVSSAGFLFDPALAYFLQGNNLATYGDRSVYWSLLPEEKTPFETVTRGTSQWISPKK